MARARVWHTHLFSAQAPSFTGATALLPVELAVEGATVVRCLGSVMLAEPSSEAPTFISSGRAGLLVGTTATGSELTTANVNGPDWLWLGQSTMIDPTGGAFNRQITEPGGMLTRIDTQGARVLGAGENVWLVYRVDHLAGATITSLSQLVRVLVVLPE